MWPPRWCAGVNSVDDLLAANIVSCTKAAAQKASAPTGMSGRDALAKLI